MEEVDVTTERPVQIVSLSHVNDPTSTPLFPGDPDFVAETVFTIAEDGFYLRYVSQGEHTGTHWGAPGHFRQGGLLADDLDVEDLFLPAVKVDVRDRAVVDADYAVTIDDLVEWEARHGRMPDACALILWTGWESRWGTAEYANADPGGVMHQPGFRAETVHWLVDTGRLAVRGALGTDTFGPDLGRDGSYAASKVLFDEHRISLANLANLAALPTRGSHVLVGGPMNRAGSGGPAAVYAVSPL